MYLYWVYLYLYIILVFVFLFAYYLHLHLCLYLYLYVKRYQTHKKPRCQRNRTHLINYSANLTVRKPRQIIDRLVSKFMFVPYDSPYGICGKRGRIFARLEDETQLLISLYFKCIDGMRNLHNISSVSHTKIGKSVSHGYIFFVKAPAVFL